MILEWRVARRALKEEGYAVDLAEDEEKTLSPQEAHECDLMSRDLLPPKANGWPEFGLF